MGSFEGLPVELIAEVLGELDLQSLITTSRLSRRLRSVVSDSSLNPWRKPILRNLQNPPYESSLKHLAARYTVPRQNGVEIVSLSKAEWLLFEATLPNLKESEWEECFNRRFLPGWRRWKSEGMTWRTTFLRVLQRVHHRSITSCTTDESWTKYILIRRNGVANELQASSRNFNPMVLFDDLKMQSNLDHLETRIRLVVELTDVRIIAFGVLNKPRGSTTANTNARLLLHPPGVEKDAAEGATGSATTAESEPKIPTRPLFGGDVSQIYRHMSHPLPEASHANYPLYTPGGGDKRWLENGAIEEDGLQWVGGLMLTAQIIGPRTKEHFTEGPPLQDWDLVVGSNRAQYASFTFADLAAIAPWLDIPKKIDGPGLGND